MEKTIDKISLYTNINKQYMQFHSVAHSSQPLPYLPGDGRAVTVP
jgi:hypothetical protein